jgi:fructoselysine-6-P-deglycase FrlB-like protein
MSRVEEALRTQRETWREISERVSALSSREFPHEPPKRILLFGVGSSHFAARLIGLTLIRDKSRVRTPVLSCPSTAIGHDVLPGKGDWAFALTHRGKSAATLQAMEICDRAGAFTLQVSGKDAPQAESARYMLPTVAMETVEPHTISVTGAVCAVTTLLLGAKAVEEWDALRSIGEPDIEVLKRRAGDGPAVILGEWEGEWLAREGALKLLEMAKTPALSYGSEEFFHGPRAAVGSDARVWHVSLPKDPRQSEIKASHTIGIFGQSPLAWVPALIELQWLAFAVALNRGVDPDKA